MRGALIHGVLLAVMLVYGYRTWTRDKTVKVDLGSHVLWDKSEKDIVSIAYKSESREVKLEQRTAPNGEIYWWGTDTTITKQPKMPPMPPTPDPTMAPPGGDPHGADPHGHGGRMDPHGATPPPAGGSATGGPATPRSVPGRPWTIT